VFILNYQQKDTVFDLPTLKFKFNEIYFLILNKKLCGNLILLKLIIQNGNKDMMIQWIHQMIHLAINTILIIIKIIINGITIIIINGITIIIINGITITIIIINGITITIIIINGITITIIDGIIITIIDGIIITITSLNRIKNKII
jgi:hypothetical protein